MFNGIETQLLTMIIQLDRFDEPKIPFQKQFQPNEIAFDAEDREATDARAGDQ